MAKLPTLKSSLPILGTTGIRLLDTKWSQNSARILDDETPR